MKYLLSFLIILNRILIGIFGGMIVIVIISSLVMLFTGPTVQGGLVGDWSSAPFILMGLGTLYFGAITLFLTVTYFILKKILNKKLNIKNGA